MRSGGSYLRNTGVGAAKLVERGGIEHERGNRARDEKGKPYALKQRSGSADKESNLRPDRRPTLHLKPGSGGAGKKSSKQKSGPVVVRRRARRIQKEN